MKGRTRNSDLIYRYPNEIDFRAFPHLTTQVTYNDFTENENLVEASDTDLDEIYDTKNEKTYLSPYCHQRGKRLIPFGPTEKKTSVYRLARPVEVIGSFEEGDKEVLRIDVEGLGVCEVFKHDNLIISSV